mmetsp:Transcript_17603/g.53891  ORF Transcript_17603/g.53891 Transcript_17603/m.53891 type:complete len:471 (-) Transcript_17603:968-2380(-)
MAGGGASAAAAPAAAATGPTAKTRRWRWRWMAAVALDCIGVALVVPLLPYYYKDLGIDAALYGRLGAVYNLSQIVGGVAMGYLADRQFGRRAVFLVSLAGTGVSYAMVATAETVPFLIASRVLVGLVKQTMTVGNALMTELSSPGERAAVMGQLTAVTRVGWLGGQALGGFLSGRSGMRRLPAMVSAALFLLNFLLVSVYIPAEDAAAADKKKKDDGDGGAAKAADEPKGEVATADGAGSTEAGAKGFFGAMWESVSNTLGPAMATIRANPALGTVLGMRLLYFFIRSSMRSMGAFYEQERFGIDPEWAGYVSAFRGAFDVALQGVFLGRLVAWLGERGTVTAAMGALTLFAFLESWPALVGRWTYSLVLSPLNTLLVSLAQTCMSSLYSKATPGSDVTSAFGAFNVFRAIVGVAAPLYGGTLLSYFGPEYKPVLSGLHLLFYTGLLVLMLPSLSRAPAKGAAAKAVKSD